MGLFDNILNALLRRVFDKNEDVFMKAIHNVNNGGGNDDVDVVAQDYYLIIRSVYQGEQPEWVALDDDDHDVVIIDGTHYDFCELISHDDQRNTGRRMEIEALIASMNLRRIERKLNQLITEEWSQ